MELTTRINEHICVLTISGEVDLYNTKQLNDAINDAALSEHKHVIINFEACPYIDSSGIGALVSAQSRLRKSGGQLTLSNVHGQIERIFALTKLDQVFSIFKNESEAFAELEKALPSPS